MNGARHGKRNLMEKNAMYWKWENWNETDPHGRILGQNIIFKEKKRKICE